MTFLACLIIRTRRGDLLGLVRIVIGPLLQGLSMHPPRHVCVEGIKVFERDVTVATPVFGNMEFYLMVNLPSTLALEGEVTFRTETVSCSDAVVLKDI